MNDNENRKAILLVEDEAIIAMVQKKQLEKAGYIVHHVGNGEKAVQTIRDETPPVDLVLMDINLGGGIDGTQAAAEILQQMDIPVVFLSSHTEPEVVEKTEKITSYGYVVKNSGTVVLDASIKMAFKLFDANKRTQRINDKLESTIESLRIHQIELKMQNEELHSNQHELEALRSKYTDLYDFSPSANFTLSDAGLILEANLTGADLLGVTRSELLGQSLTSFISNEDQDKFYKVRRVILEKRIAQTCELRIKKSDGSTLSAHMKAVTTDSGNGLQSLLVVMIGHEAHL